MTMRWRHPPHLILRRVHITPAAYTQRQQKCHASKCEVSATMLLTATRNAAPRRAHEHSIAIDGLRSRCWIQDDFDDGIHITDWLIMPLYFREKIQANSTYHNFREGCSVIPHVGEYAVYISVIFTGDWVAADDDIASVTAIRQIHA